MGSGFSAALVASGSAPGWLEKGRGPKLRQLFGGYRGPDIWAVQRKFKSLDDGHGFLSFEEVQDLLYFEEPGLLFIWDLFSQQNELINAKELLTVVCIFSSAFCEEKARFLAAVFDNSGRGLCTGKEMAESCMMVLTVLGKCTGAMAKAKEVTPQIQAELCDLIPVCAEMAEMYGAKEAFQNERVIGQLEVDRFITPSIRDAYEELPLVDAVTGAALPPPPGWATAQTRETMPVPAAKKETKGPKEVKEAKPQDELPAGADPSLRHLSWMRRLEEKENVPMAGYADCTEVVDAAHRWIIMQEAEFSSIAKDIPGFKVTFCKSVCSALGLPVHGNCVEVLNVTNGSGSIIVELLMRPRSHTDSRTAIALAGLLEKQLASPYSALRRGQLSKYLVSALLLAAAPQAVCDETIAPPPATPKGPACPPIPVQVQDFGTQTDTFELGTPRAVVIKGAAATGACTRQEEEQLATQIREAVRQLEMARNRQTKAKAGEKKALEEIRKRDELISQLRDEMGA